MPRPRVLRSVLLFLAGGAIGFLLWWYSTPEYNELLARGARLLLAPTRFASASFDVSGREIVVSSRSLPTARIAADQLTSNIILLLGLFAATPRIFRDRNIVRFVIAIAVLALTHILATAVDVMDTYATRLGPWSNAHFSPLEQDVWNAIDYAYRLAGMYAIAFGCWWGARSH